MERCSNGFPGGASEVVDVEDSRSDSFVRQFADILNRAVGAESVSGDADFTPSMGHVGSAVSDVVNELQQNSFAGFDFQNMLRHSSLPVVPHKAVAEVSRRGKP